MIRIVIAIVLGSMMACTPHKKFRDRLVHAGRVPEGAYEFSDVSEKVDFLESSTSALQLPRVSLQGEPWLPRTLASRDLEVEWSQDHQRVFVRGSVQWTSPTGRVTKDMSFTLVGKWDSEAGKTNLVPVTKETNGIGISASALRGRIYCIEVAEGGFCRSTVVELFVRDGGTIYSGQVEKLAPIPDEPEAAPEEGSSGDNGEAYNDEIEGFDRDLEAVGSDEETLDKLYKQKVIEKEDDQIIDEPEVPAPIKPEDKDNLKDVPEDQELKEAMKAVESSGPPQVVSGAKEKTVVPKSTGFPEAKPLETTPAKDASPKTVPLVPSKTPTQVQKKEESVDLPVSKVGSGTKSIVRVESQPLLNPSLPLLPARKDVTPKEEKNREPVNPTVKSEIKVKEIDSSATSTVVVKGSQSSENPTASLVGGTSRVSRADSAIASPFDESISATNHFSTDSVAQALRSPEDTVVVVPATQQVSATKTKHESSEAVSSVPSSDIGAQKYEDQSIGIHSRGSLRTATSLKTVIEKLAERSRIRVVHANQKRYFGNYASIEFLVKSSLLLNRLEPGTLLEVGDISAERGGKLRPHRSHQNGLDMDIGFLLNGTLSDYYGQSVLRGGRLRPEFARKLQWQFFKSMMTYYHDKIYFILLHPEVKKAMCEEAIRSGDIVQGKEIDPIVMHTLRRLVPERSHHDHFHVRLKCPAKDSRCIQPTRDIQASMGCSKSKK